jgi:hypothetical protein
MFFFAKDEILFSQYTQYSENRESTKPVVLGMWKVQTLNLGFKQNNLV